jgi:hypothetical protein
MITIFAKQAKVGSVISFKNLANRWYYFLSTSTIINHDNGTSIHLLSNNMKILKWKIHPNTQINQLSN